MATHHTHFSEEPPQVINQADLDRANEKLEDAADDSSKDETVAKDHHDSAVTDHINNKEAQGNGSNLEKLGTYDKYELTEDDCYDELGFSFPSWKKWYILTIIFIVQGTAHGSHKAIVDD